MLKNILFSESFKIYNKEKLNIVYGNFPGASNEKMVLISNVCRTHENQMAVIFRALLICYILFMVFHVFSPIFL